MSIRYERDEEFIATALRRVGGGLRDVQRATGTEKARTMLAAQEALTSANGKSKVWFSSTPPPGVDHKVGDTWFDASNSNRINEWDGDDWVPVKLGENAIEDLAITNAKIANLDGGKIVAGSIDTLQLNADAIDGMTITGATIRTAASGQRLQLDVDGLKAYDPSGTEVAHLRSDIAGFQIGTYEDGTTSSISNNSFTVQPLGYTSPSATFGPDYASINKVSAGKSEYTSIDPNGFSASTSSEAADPEQPNSWSNVSGHAIESSARFQISHTTGGPSPRGKLSEWTVSDHPTDGVISRMTVDRVNADTVEAQEIRSSLYTADLHVNISTVSPSGAIFLTSPFIGVNGLVDFQDDTKFKGPVEFQDDTKFDGPVEFQGDVTHNGKLWAGDALRGNATKMNALHTDGKAYDGLKFWRTDQLCFYLYVGGSWFRESTSVSDRPWARIDSTTYGPAIGTLGTGVTHVTAAPYSGLQARVKGGVLYISGALGRVGGFPSNHVLFTLGANFLPGAPSVQYAYASGHNFVVATTTGAVIIAIGTASADISLGLTVPLS